MVETEIKKSHAKEEVERLQGGWHNAISLKQEGWTELLGSAFQLGHLCTFHSEHL